MKLKKAICLTLVLIFIAITPVCCFGIRKTAKRQLDEVTKLATKRFVEEGHVDREHCEKAADGRIDVILLKKRGKAKIENMPVKKAEELFS